MQSINVRPIEKVFVAGLLLILLFMMVHDGVPLGKLNDPSAVRSQQTVTQLWTATLLNTGSVLVVLALALWSAGKPKIPVWVRVWLAVHLTGIRAGAIAAWWIPYFAGADPELVARYDAMFGDTHAFLPERNGIVPNTIHVLFHATLLAMWGIAVYLALRNGTKVADGTDRLTEHSG